MWPRPAPRLLRRNSLLFSKAPTICAPTMYARSNTRLPCGPHCRPAANLNFLLQLCSNAKVFANLQQFMLFQAQENGLKKRVGNDAETLRHRRDSRQGEHVADDGA